METRIVSIPEVNMSQVWDKNAILEDPSSRAQIYLPTGIPFSKLTERKAREGEKSQFSDLKAVSNPTNIRAKELSLKTEIR